MKIYAENMHQKLVRDQCFKKFKKFFMKLNIFKEDYKKYSKNLTSFLLSNPVSFFGSYYKKQKVSGVTSLFSYC